MRGGGRLSSRFYLSAVDSANQPVPHRLGRRIPRLQRLRCSFSSSNDSYATLAGTASSAAADDDAKGEQQRRERSREATPARERRLQTAAQQSAPKVSKAVASAGQLKGLR